jgi:hypothetical protein
MLAKVSDLTSLLASSIHSASQPIYLKDIVIVVPLLRQVSQHLSFLKVLRQKLCTRRTFPPVHIHVLRRFHLPLNRPSDAGCNVSGIKFWELNMKVNLLTYLF